MFSKPILENPSLMGGLLGSSSRRGSEDAASTSRDEETDFGGGDERTKLLEESMTAAEKNTKKRWPRYDAEKAKFTVKLDFFDNVIARLIKKDKAAEYVILNEDGTLAKDYYKKKFPDTIKEGLSKTREEIITENEAEEKRLDEPYKNFMGELANADENQRPSIEHNIELVNERREAVQAETQNLREGMSL